jgi:hypothetical protein
MRISSYVLVLISALLLMGSIISIVVLLDSGAQVAINDVIHSLQRKTLGLSVESIKRDVLSVIPILLKQVRVEQTGWFECADMDKLDLKYFFEDQHRIQDLRYAAYVYTSTEYQPGKVWNDCNCYNTQEGGVDCLRPIWQVGPNGTNLQELYTGTYPMNVTEPKDVMEFNNIDQYYVQRIMNMTNADVNGSWSAPYYFWDSVAGLPFALQTISVPLRFDNVTGKCTKAQSVDVSLKNVRAALRTARTSDQSTLFIISPGDDSLVSSSDTTLSLWDDNQQLWNSQRTPSALINAAAKEFYAQTPQDVRVNAVEGYFTQFSMSFGGDSYLVATLHMRDRNLLWVMVDVTPRSHYYATLDNSRTVSVTIGSVIGAVALVVTIAMFVVIIRSLQKLGAEMDKLSTMDVDSEPIPASAISEIDHMISTFNLVVKNMKLFKSLMPSSAFDTGGDTDSEEEEETENRTREDGSVARVEVDGGNRATDMKRTMSRMQNSSTRKRNNSSTVSPMSRGSRNNPAANNKTNLRDAFALRLDSKAAVVAEVRIKDFTSFAMGNPSEVVIAAHGNHITKCNEVMKEAKGVMGTIIADRITYHWNVQNRVAAAPAKAAKGSVLVSRAFDNVMVCVHTCTVMGGYMGTDGIRGYHLVGPHTDLLHSMFGRLPKLEVRVLCTLPFWQEVWTSFDGREVDEMDGVRLFQILSEAKQGDDEWMYQLEGNDAKTGKHAAFDQGWTLWREKNYTGAVDVLKVYVSAHPEDNVAKALFVRWMQAMETLV